MRAFKKEGFTRLFASIVGIVCVVFLVSAGPISAQEKIVKLSICVLGPPTSTINKGTIMPLVEELEATGKVKVTLYGAGSPYGLGEKFLTQIDTGIVDMAWSTYSYFIGQLPLNLLLQEPFIVDDTAAATRAFKRLFAENKHLSGEWPKSVRVMQVFPVGGYQLHTRDPFAKFEDIAGRRIACTHASLKTIVSDVGASLAALPVGVQYENLSKGVIDGQIATWSSLLAFRTIEVTSHHFGLNLAAVPMFLAMNKKKYESLPNDIRAILDRWSSVDKALKLAKVWDSIDEQAIAEAKKLGHTVRLATREERETLKKRFFYVTEEIMKKHEQKGLPAHEVYKALTKAIEEEEAKK